MIRLSDGDRKAVREILEEIKSRPEAKTLEEKRDAFRFLCSFSGPAVEVPSRSFQVPTRDRQAIEIRQYGEGSICLVWFHGGGYVCGDLETHHAAMTQLATLDKRVSIINVGYRRAPEFKFPTALQDAEDALLFIRATMNVDRLVLGGDSAGGNLAAALSLKGVASDAQILCYPTLDARFRAESWHDVKVQAIANRKGSLDFDLMYARNDADLDDPLFSPAFVASETLRTNPQPQTTVFLGECDPAKGDGAMYAERLKNAGVRTNVYHFEGMVHAFLTMAGRLEASRTLHREIITAALASR